MTAMLAKIRENARQDLSKPFWQSQWKQLSVLVGVVAIGAFRSREFLIGAAAGGVMGFVQKGIHWRLEQHVESWKDIRKVLSLPNRNVLQRSFLQLNNLFFGAINIVALNILFFGVLQTKLAGMLVSASLLTPMTALGVSICALAVLRQLSISLLAPNHFTTSVACPKWGARFLIQGTIAGLTYGTVMSKFGLAGLVGASLAVPISGVVFNQVRQALIQSAK